MELMSVQEALEFMRKVKGASLLEQALKIAEDVFQRCCECVVRCARMVSEVPSTQPTEGRTKHSKLRGL